jgi:hypothetical protein
MESLTSVMSQVTKFLSTLEHEDLDTQLNYWLTGDSSEEALDLISSKTTNENLHDQAQAVKESFVEWSSLLFEKEGISDDLVRGFTESNTVLGLPEFFVGVDYSHPVDKSL